MARRRDWVALSKPPLFALCLLPLALLVWNAAQGTLGPDPVAQLEHRSGDWALRLLLATLAVTPLRRVTGVSKLVRYRRLLGLFAFFYVCVHMSIYLAIDLGGFWSQIFAEIARKPYITVGFTAWLLLIPLALTSTKGMMRRLGRRWQQLHRLVYVIPLLGVLHYAWMVKSGNAIANREPLYYGAAFAALMLWRVPWARLRDGLPALRAGTAAAARCPDPAARR